MKASRRRIAQTVADHTLANGMSKDYARELAAYLLAERRVGELDSLLRDIQAAWADKGYVEVLARSAHPLTAEVKNGIVAHIKALHPEAKKVVVTEVTDSTVVGGVRIDLANQQLDLSVKAKLHKFKQLNKSLKG